MPDLTPAAALDRNPAPSRAGSLGPKLLFVRTRCMESGGWSMNLGLEEQDLEQVLADGAREVTLTIDAYCPFCDRRHDFSLPVERSDAQQALAGAAGRGRGKRLGPNLLLARELQMRAPATFRNDPSNLHTPAVNIDTSNMGPVLKPADAAALYERGAGLTRSDNEASLQTNTVTIDTSDLGPVLKPRDAAALYERGAGLTRSDDEASLRDACAALNQAIIIYLDNDRPRDAAYARTFLVSALIKLADPTAKDEIAAARAALTAADDDMLRYLDTLEKQLPQP